MCTSCSPESTETTYTVTGMTCSHCVASVTEEVSEIEGVRDVVVDLASGKLTFNSDEPVSHDAVEAAVREAGYTLA
ncbi:MAG: heavy-metal-associated domain-containing protein [Acidimicrobiaceae bacterium]|nr:heavy-metal-associated domain-containing protein [Acidimicrobiaceae bacterium]